MPDVDVRQQVPRPGTLLAGIVLTYVGSGILVVLGLIIVLIFVPAGGVDSFMQGLGVYADPARARAVAIGTGVGILAQGVVLIVGAVLAHKGRNGGRVTLTVVAGLNILYNVYQLANGNVQIVLVLGYVVATLVLLWSGGANAWYRDQRAARRG